MVYRAESYTTPAPKKKKSRRRVVSERPNAKNPFATGSRSGGGGYSSGFGGFLQSAFGTALDSISGAANSPKVQDAINSNPHSGLRLVADQTTIKPKKPKQPSQPSPLDTLEALNQSLMADAASQTFDYEAATQQAIQGIRQAYGAEIDAIRSNNLAAKKETTKDRKTIEAMFNGLAKSYGRASDASEVQGDRAGKAMLALANQASGQVAATQKKTTGEEAQMLKDLHQEATADQVIKPDFENTKSETAKINQHGARKAEAEKAYAQADARFFDRGAVGAQFEGEGRAADLLTQLQDYLRQNRGQIATLKGNRAKEVGQTRLSAKQAAATAQAAAQAKAESDLWNRVMDITNLQYKVENTNIDNKRENRKLALAAQKQNNAKTSTPSYLPKNLSNAVNLLGPRKATKLLPILEGLWGSDVFRQGKVTQKGKGGQTSSYKLTQFEAGAMAEKAGKQAGLSTQEVNMLKLAAMASVG